MIKSGIQLIYVLRYLNFYKNDIKKIYKCMLDNFYFEICVCFLKILELNK